MTTHLAMPKLSIGDIAPGFQLLSLKGESVDLRSDSLAGKLAILLFLPLGTKPSDLQGFMALASDFAKFQTRLYVIARTREQLEGGPAEFVLLPGDSDQKIFTAYAAGQDFRAVLVGPNRHIAALFDGMDCAPALLRKVEEMARLYLSARLSNHPPVMILPDILSHEDCQHLINVYAMQGNRFVEPSHGTPSGTGDYKMRIPDYGRKDRIDHWIVQPETNQFIDERLGKRLFPEILKAFQYRVTKRESYRIGCYEGERGGSLHGHRDNTSPKVAHRRFACSINLNTEDFEGGELRFPEYGNHLYRPPTGSAIVFSSSLFHEPLHVTSGKRFVLLAFLYGDY